LVRQRYRSTGEETSDMTDQADTPSQDGPAQTPFKHTRWQALYRALFQVYGPAQTGLPPYATPEEREAWLRANPPQPQTRTPAPPKRGYQVVEYRDGQGYLHRSLVPVPPE
jgi:hypothetical protein